MRRHLSIAARAVGLLGLATSTLAAEEFSMIELVAPRAAARGEALELAVTAGPLPPGARLTLSTESGEVLGAVAPYSPERRAATATVPVPRSAVVDGRLRLQVLEPRVAPRAPKPGEVQRLDLVVAPRSE